MAERRVVYQLNYRTESVQKGTKKVDSALKKTDAQFKKSGKPVKDLTTHHKKLSDAQKKTSRAFTTTGKQVKKSTGQFNKLGSTIGSVKGLMAGLGVTVGGLMILRTIQGWTKAALEFEKQTNKVHTSLVLLGSEDVIPRETLDSIFLLAAAMTGIEGGTETATKAFDAMVTSEWSVNEATRDLIPILNFAQVSGMEVGAAVNFAAKAQTLFGKETEDTTEVLAMMFDAVTEGHLEVATLGSAMDKTGLKAKRAKVSYEQFLIINREMSKELGGRKLLSEQGMVFELLLGSTAQATEVLAELNVENATFVEKLEAIAKAEDENSDALNRLTAGNNIYREMILDMIDLLPMLRNENEELSKSLDQYNRALEDYTVSNEAKLNRLNAAWENTKVVLGTVLVDMADNVVSAFGTIGDTLGKSMEELDAYMFQILRTSLAVSTFGVSEATIIPTLNEFRENIKEAGKYMGELGEATETTEEKIKRMEAKYPGFTWGVTEEKPPITQPTGVPGAAGAPPTRVREKTPEEEIADAIRVVDAEYARRANREAWLLDTTEQARIVGLESEFEARSDKEKEIEERRAANAKVMGDLAGDTLVAAISGRDVLGALKSTFFDMLGSLVSAAFSMIPGIGGLLSFLPFEKGGVFDPIHAQRGQIFKPRPGGYNVVLGEPSTGGEAVTPFNNYGKELLRNYVIPKHFPELMSPAAYTGIGGGGTQSVNVEPASVTVVVDGLDPRSLRAKQTVDRGSRAKAAVAG